MNMTVQNSQPDCLFCKIIEGSIPAKEILRTDKAVVFEDIFPQAPVHLLIIATTHTASHLETQDATLYADVMEAAKQAAELLGLQHYRLVMNNGAEVGQSVFHMHLHLLAGRPMQWPPG